MIPTEAALLAQLLKREEWESFGELVDPERLPSKEYVRLFDLISQYHTRDLGMPTEPNMRADLLWDIVCQKDGVTVEHASYQPYVELIAMIKNDKTPAGVAQDLVQDFVRSSALDQLATLSLKWAEVGGPNQKEEVWKRAKQLAAALDELDGHGQKVRSRSLRNEPDLVGLDYERIPMGVAPKIDEATGGGFPVGKIVCAVAPPGVGKTRLLVNIGAEAVRLGRNVLHATLEIDEVELCRWYYTILTGISYDSLRDDLAARAEAEAIWRSHPEWGDVITADYSADSCYIGTIKRLIKRTTTELAEKDQKLTIFLLDYIALVDGISDNLYTGLGAACRELRKLSKRHKMLTFTAAQANRGAMIEGETRLWHIADSMEIPRVVDALLMLSQNDQEKELGTLRLKMDKNRFGSKNPRVSIDLDTTGTLRMQQRGTQ